MKMKIYFAMERTSSRNAKRKQDEFIFCHNPKRKNLILLELKLRSFITWNEMFMIMLRASTPVTIYTAILKANNDNEMFAIHSLSLPPYHFPFSGSEIKVMRLLSWAKDSNLIFLFIHFLLHLEANKRVNGSWGRKPRVNACFAMAQ